MSISTINWASCILDQRWNQIFLVGQNKFGAENCDDTINTVFGLHEVGYAGAIAHEPYEIDIMEWRLLVDVCDPYYRRSMYRWINNSMEEHNKLPCGHTRS